MLNYQDLSDFATRLVAVAQRSNNDAIADEIQTRVAQLKNAVAHVDVFTTGVANQSYTKCSAFLKQQANSLASHYQPNDYLLSGVESEGVNDRLELIDPLAHDIDTKNPVDQERRLVLAHLTILRDDAVHQVRMHGKLYSFQRLLQDECYFGLKAKLIRFLFVKGVWSERRSFELCLQGFNVVKPWDERNCISLSFDTAGVHHHGKLLYLERLRYPTLNVVPTPFKIHHFNQ